MRNAVMIFVIPCWQVERLSVSRHEGQGKLLERQRRFRHSGSEFRTVELAAAI